MNEPDEDGNYVCPDCIVGRRPIAGGILMMCITCGGDGKISWVEKVLNKTNELFVEYPADNPDHE